MRNIKPFIFTKKINNKYKVVPLNVITNTSGPARHFLPATREWFNSVYAFNRNSIKNLSVAEKIVIKLIKSYFNLFFNKKILKSKRLATRFRRLAINRIFISKVELKHTSSKVIITLYAYNEERRILIRKIKRLETILFLFYYSTLQGKNMNKNISIEEKLSIINTQGNNILFMDWLYKLKSYIIEQIKWEENYLLSVKINKLIEDKLLEIGKLKKDLIRIINIIGICENDPISYNYYEKYYKGFLFKVHLEKEINTIAYYKLLLNLNKSKFEEKMLSRIRPLISKMYNKEVEFNVINLKTLYLNSNIFTEIISLKLKNRDNKLLRVLKSSLSLVKLPKINKIREQYKKINIKELWVNKINNLNINILNNDYNKDSLNKILLNIFHNSSYLFDYENNKNEYKGNNLLSNFVLNELKYKNTAGVRLEVKGRLTRRFTASRSVFKIKWKGSLKNLDSSYRRLPSIILRGHVKPNVQYSLINSKTRNGAFGVKGWISNK
jgi:hypothetical protein